MLYRCMSKTQELTEALKTTAFELVKVEGIEAIEAEMEPIFKQHSGTKPQHLVAEKIMNATDDLIDARKAFEWGVTDMVPQSKMTELAKQMAKCSDRIANLTAYVAREESGN